MRSSLVLPPLITSPQSAPQDGRRLLESFQAYSRQDGNIIVQQLEGQRGPLARSVSRSPSSSGHRSGSNLSSLPSPLLAPATSRAPLSASAPATRARGKSPERANAGRKSEMKVERGAAGEDIITLFPRRKAGQTRPGGGRGPVVLNLELLEKFYYLPLHVAANRLVSIHVFQHFTLLTIILFPPAACVALLPQLGLLLDAYLFYLVSGQILTPLTVPAKTMTADSVPCKNRGYARQQLKKCADDWAS